MIASMRLGIYVTGIMTIAVIAISAYDIHRVRFCDHCGATNWTLGFGNTVRYCSNCGSPLSERQL
jgi:hypothetical protein